MTRRTYTYVCFACRRSASSSGYPRCPGCAGQMTQLADYGENPPPRRKEKAWIDLHEKVSRRQYHRRVVIDEPLEDAPPIKLDRPGKKKGSWLTWTEVTDLLQQHHLSRESVWGNLRRHFTATTMRRVQDQYVYHRPAVLVMIERLKAERVENALKERA